MSDPTPAKTAAYYDDMTAGLEHRSTPKPSNKDALRARKRAIREGRLVVDSGPTQAEADAAAAAEVEAQEATAAAEKDRIARATERAKARHGGQLPGVSGKVEGLVGSASEVETMPIGGRDVSMDVVVQHAFTRSGLTVDEWNGLEPSERERKILATVQAMDAASEVDAPPAEAPPAEAPPAEAPPAEAPPAEPEDLLS